MSLQFENCLSSLDIFGLVGSIPLCVLVQIDMVQFLTSMFQSIHLWSSINNYCLIQTSMVQFSHLWYSIDIYGLDQTSIVQTRHLLSRLDIYGIDQTSMVQARSLWSSDSSLDIYGLIGSHQIVVVDVVEDAFAAADLSEAGQPVANVIKLFYPLSLLASKLV